MNWINMALKKFLSRETLSRNENFLNIYLCVILKWYSKPLIFFRFFYIVFLVINILRHGLVIQYRVSIWRPIYRLIHFFEIYHSRTCYFWKKNIWTYKTLAKMPNMHYFEKKSPKKIWNFSMAYIKSYYYLESKIVMKRILTWILYKL